MQVETIMTRLKWLLIVGTLAGFSANAAENTSQIAKQALSLHNQERATLGLPPLVWNERLAKSAETWAAKLSRSDVLQHEYQGDPSGQGENLWMGSRGYYSIDEMIGDWSAEKARFRRGKMPNISHQGDWEAVGHYSQMVWRETRAVGCAIAHSPDWDVLVCRYDPPGNVWGQDPF